ncbi:hypothetical protein BDY21DRAFT_187622 [Lineolata rhizophorae]|uniref:Uncharacterized protein n=1 Tax=Lineolata rhizophorae TaxID=578093 RepID=A0A6A6P5K1_9PEZI|nr:hypothetical protein BDY21DRAFT_187622 [Lineolata rhizophorae]
MAFECNCRAADPCAWYGVVWICRVVRNTQAEVCACPQYLDRFACNLRPWVTSGGIGTAQGSEEQDARSRDGDRDALTSWGMFGEAGPHSPLRRARGGAAAPSNAPSPGSHTRSPRAGESTSVALHHPRGLLLRQCMPQHHSRALPFANLPFYFAAALSHAICSWATPGCCLQRDCRTTTRGSRLRAPLLAGATRRRLRPRCRSPAHPREPPGDLSRVWPLSTLKTALHRAWVPRIRYCIKGARVRSV